MSKPYTESDLTSQLIADRNWRLKEISDLKTAAYRGDNSLRTVLLRALVTICYAHWEGYVRFAARKYLEHIALKRLPYKKLGRQFLRNYFMPRLAALSRSNSSLMERCNLVDQILGASDLRFSRVHEDLVNTRSNLNFEVFSDICLVCSISVDPFAGDRNFIDIVLLKRRNAIAHGEDTFVAIDALELLSNQTIALMRGFGDALENIVYQKEYAAA